MNAICIIPARGGSKRIPRKNIKIFRGQPIIGYAIQAAQKSELFDHIIVSTDDREISDVSMSLGASVFMRMKDDGTRGTQDVAKQVLYSYTEARYACVIYPCSPLLDEYLLLIGWFGLMGNNSLSRIKEYVMSVDSNGNDAGCYYWGQSAAFMTSYPLNTLRTKRVALPVGRACDINTPEDWARAEQMYDALKAKNANS